MACFSLSLAKTHSMVFSAYRRNGHPYRCWISTILNSTTRFMLGLPLYSQYNDSTTSYRHLKLFPEANDPLVPSSLFSPSLSHYDPFSTFPYLNHYLRSLTLSKNELLTMHLRQYKTAKDRQQKVAPQKDNYKTDFAHQYGGVCKICRRLHIFP